MKFGALEESLKFLSEKNFNLKLQNLVFSVCILVEKNLVSNLQL